MILKKIERKTLPGGDLEEVSVTVEPKYGYSDAEVIRSLNSIGASRVEVLAPGFISARVKRNFIYELDLIAEVHPSPLKQTRGLFNSSR